MSTCMWQEASTINQQNISTGSNKEVTWGVQFSEMVAASCCNWIKLHNCRCWDCYQRELNRKSSNSQPQSSSNTWPLVQDTSTFWVASFPVPRPSHSPVFEYVKTKGGKAWFIYHKYDVSVYLGRQVSERKDTFCIRVVRFEPGTIRFSLYEHSKLQRLGQKLQDKASSSFFNQGPLHIH